VGVTVQGLGEEPPAAGGKRGFGGRAPDGRFLQFFPQKFEYTLVER